MSSVKIKFSNISRNTNGENNIHNIIYIEIRRFRDQIGLDTLVVFTVKTVCFLLTLMINKRASAVKHTAWEIRSQG